MVASLNVIICCEENEQNVTDYIPNFRSLNSDSSFSAMYACCYNVLFLI